MVQQNKDSYEEKQSFHINKFQAHTKLVTSELRSYIGLRFPHR